MKKNFLIKTIISFTLFSIMFVGTTYALLNGKDNNDNKNPNINMYVLNEEGKYLPTSENGIFNYNGNKLYIEPGKEISRTVKIQNEGNLNLEYSFNLSLHKSSLHLTDKIEITITAKHLTNPIILYGKDNETNSLKKFISHSILEKNTFHEFEISIKLLEGASNDYQNKNFTFDIFLRTWQSNKNVKS